MLSHIFQDLCFYHSVRYRLEMPRWWFRCVLSTLLNNIEYYVYSLLCWGFRCQILLNQVAQPENNTTIWRFQVPPEGPSERCFKVEPVAAAASPLWDAVAGVAWDTQKIARKMLSLKHPRFDIITSLTPQGLTWFNHLPDFQIPCSCNCWQFLGWTLGGMWKPTSISKALGNDGRFDSTPDLAF